MTGIMFIMQGPPGSGKSTTAQRIAAARFSTDDYFEESGFIKEELPKAHKWNQDRVRAFLRSSRSHRLVVIDNTNIKCWEARPYVEMAVEFSMVVVFVRCEGAFQNIHGVPDDVVDRMRSTMEFLSVKSCLEAKYPWE